MARASFIVDDLIDFFIQLGVLNHIGVDQYFGGLEHMLRNTARFFVMGCLRQSVFKMTL